ncbi:MAG: RNA polymerase sigma factor [Verrucomicrobiales bacterium]|nr:RNA polymerase sigma factor [Verrucomicrobiales bacterium]
MAERDQALIAEFSASRSEAAFAALVRLHVNLVFATALRQVGDRGIAEEVTQDVFVALAQHSGKLRRHPTIAGWLHQTTLNKSRQRMRSELRRDRRQQTAIHLDLAKGEGDSVWAPLVPLLDEALMDLREPDRLAVILHFMEGHSFRDVGAALGAGEDATRKRVKACLDRLTAFFRRHGFAVPVLAAGAPLFTLSSHAAPPGLAASVTAAGLSAAKIAGTSGLTLYSIMASAKIKIAAGVIIVAGFGTTILLEERVQTRLRNDNAVLQRRVESLDQENQRLVSQANQGNAQSVDAENVAAKPRRLSLAELPAAIQAVLKKPFSQHATAFKEIIAAVDASDVPQAVAMLEKFPNFEAKTTLRSLFLSRWAETDANAAMAAAETTGDAQYRKKAVLAVARAWAGIDPDSALAWAQKLPASQDRSQILQSIIASLAETDPQRAAILAMEMPGRWKMFTAEQVAALWAQTDPDGALAWLQTLPVGEAKTRSLDAISKSLAEADPQKAAELVSSLPPPQRRHFLDEIASSWARKDLAGALAWAEQLEARDRKAASPSIFEQWVQSDPKAAAAYAQKAQPYSLYTVGWHWGENDPKAAMEWANHLPEGNDRNEMIQAIFSGWGYNSPADAANHIANLPADTARNSAAERVVSAWAENDPTAAASWALSIPEGDARRVAIQNIVLKWGTSDFSATAEWLNTLAEGDSRDTAMVTFANNCLKDYAPSTALEWSQTITGDGVRNNITLKIATEWLKDDPDAARVWLASSSLPEKIKNQLLSRK